MGRSDAGHRTRRARAAPPSRHHTRRDADDDARYRRDDGALQRHIRGAAEAVAVAGFLSSRPTHRNAPRSRATSARNGPYREWAAEHSTIEAIGGWLTRTATVVIAGGEPTRMPVAAVTPSLLHVVSAAPLRGRLFVDADAKTGVAPQTSSAGVIVLSYGLSQERFGGPDAAIGRVVRVDGKPMTVVGVMPKAFAFPDRETRAWTPLAP